MSSVKKELRYFNECVKQVNECLSDCESEPDFWMARAALASAAGALTMLTYTVGQAGART